MKYVIFEGLSKTLKSIANVKLDIYFRAVESLTKMEQKLNKRETKQSWSRPKIKQSKMKQNKQSKEFDNTADANANGMID